MTTCIVTIADSKKMARTLDQYIRCFLGSRIVSYFMTYEHNLLSGSILRQTDLFIFELLRHDDIGYRAEGIFAVEKFAPIGKKTLIISSGFQSNMVDIPGYWDFAASDSLHERIQHILENPPPANHQVTRMQKVFSKFYRPMVDYHRTSR